MKKGVFSLIILATVLVLLISCASTRLTAVWSDESYAGHPIDNVMVIGISKDMTTRLLFEDTFVEQLASDNVKALASHTQFHSNIKPDRKSIEGAVKKTGVHMVIITHLIGTEERTQYHQPKPVYIPANYYGGMYGYYSRTYAYVYTPGYYTQHKVFKLETNLYNADTGKLIWSAQTETVDPGKLESEINDLVRLLINDLRKKKLL